MTVKELRDSLYALPDSAIVLASTKDGYGSAYCKPPRIIDRHERKNAEIEAADAGKQLVILEPEDEHDRHEKRKAAKCAKNHATRRPTM